MAKGAKRPVPSLTARTRWVANTGQAFVFLVGLLGVAGGVALAVEEPAAGIGVVVGALASAFPVYAVLMYIEWQVARAVLELRHSAGTSSPTEPPSRG